MALHLTLENQSGTNLSAGREVLEKIAVLASDS